MYLILLIAFVYYLSFRFASGSKIVSIFVASLLLPELYLTFTQSNVDLELPQIKKIILAIALLYAVSINFFQNLVSDRVIKFILSVNIVWASWMAMGYEMYLNSILGIILTAWLYRKNVKISFGESLRYPVGMSWIFTYSIWNIHFTIETAVHVVSIEIAAAFACLHVLVPLTVCLFDHTKWVMARTLAIGLLYIFRPYGNSFLSDTEPYKLVVSLIENDLVRYFGISI